MTTPLRLTLRTLLAYLDDTLEPAQARLIGQKVAESDTAQELITRIKQVTRRRRLTTPPETGPGSKLDPNTIAEYLDNTLDSDQLAEVEQTCLASDVHLAEVSTCHQILTLVLGEPALVPPTAKQRMYGLIKGREAIPFRKPPAPAADAADEPREGKEVDETLRLGLPALSRKGDWSNWAVIGGGALALVACLVIAFVMVLNAGRGGDDPDGPGPARDRNAQAKADGKKTDSKRVDGDQAGKDTDAKQKDKGSARDADKQQGKTDDGKKDAAVTDRDGPKDKKGQPDKKPEASGEVSLDPPSKKVTEIGKYEPPTPPAATVLLQYSPKGGGEWARLERQAKPTRVWTNQPLVSLPGFRSVVTTDSGVRLTLAGTVPEYLPGPLPLNESRVVLHAHDQLDLDLTLQRGRVLLASSRGDRPARVRVRFENSTDPKSAEMWDVILEQKDAEVLVERAGGYSPEEPFYPNPKDPLRLGPVANVGLIVLNGSVSVRVGDVTHGMNAPPGPSLVHWNSVEGPKGPFGLKKVPEFVVARPPIPKEVPADVRGDLEKARADIEKAAGQLSRDLTGRAADLGLLRARDSNDAALRKLAVRAYGALDMLPQLINALAEPKRQDVRQAAIETLRHWCGASRDNDYVLFDQLQKQDYPPAPAGNIVALLHDFSTAARGRPETYDSLILQLTTPQLPLPIRELAAFHLSRMVPEAKKDILAAPTASVEQIEGIHARLRKLIPRGQLPPSAPKDKGAEK